MEQQIQKKRIFSGIQPTGNLTLGNYLGAMKNWVTLCDEYDCYYGVVDMHSITVRQDPATLRQRARNLLMIYIAAGLDPEKNCLYYQSVPWALYQQMNMEVQHHSLHLIQSLELLHSL